MQNKRIFWRSVFISSVIIFNFILLALGISLAYENICNTFYGEDRSAIQITENEIRILDFIIEISAE